MPQQTGALDGDPDDCELDGLRLDDPDSVDALLDLPTGSDAKHLTPVSLRVTLAATINETMQSLERLPSAWSSRFSSSVLWVGLGLIFLWFGILGLVPGVSSVEGLTRSGLVGLFSLVGLSLSPTIAMFWLAILEVAIGIGFLVEARRPVLVWMLLAHLTANALPLVVLSDVVWTRLPLELTLEGQDLVKKVIFIGAALAIAGSNEAPATPPRT